MYVLYIRTNQNGGDAALSYVNRSIVALDFITAHTIAKAHLEIDLGA
jgi:hypothetical protein